MTTYVKMTGNLRLTLNEAQSLLWAIDDSLMAAQALGSNRASRRAHRKLQLATWAAEEKEKEQNEANPPTELCGGVPVEPDPLDLRIVREND